MKRRKAARSSCSQKKNTAFGAATCSELQREIHSVFRAYTRLSGVDTDTTVIRKGAVDAILAFVRSAAALPENNTSGGAPATLPFLVSDATVHALNASADTVAKSGGTPLAVAKDGRLLGIIHLKDIIKGGIRERFGALRQMGIRTVMITGDNPLTAAAIAAEAGVDDFLAQATPETKLKLIREEQAQGKLVAMCGDGTNDAPALAQADVGVAMNTGTMAAREAGNMVDLDSDPTKLIEIVEIGKQLLMTRGALTTFSIANDVAKYFAIIPAMFVAFYPQLQSLNIMHLATPQSAILSAIIFNALIIVALIPLALRGVAYRPVGAAQRPAAQSSRLWARRDYRSFHRHQAHRHCGRCGWLGLNQTTSLRKTKMIKHLLPAIMLTVLMTVADRACLSARDDGIGRPPFPLSSQGQSDRTRRKDHRL